MFDNSRVGDHGYVSNQSLNGMLRRALGTARPHVVWLALAVAIVVFGLRRATLASRGGQELLGICARSRSSGMIVSPVSWIHHLVWIVPVLAVLVGDGTDRRRVAAGRGDRRLFTLRLPYLGDNIPTGLASRVRSRRCCATPTASSASPRCSRSAARS